MRQPPSILRRHRIDQVEPPGLIAIKQPTKSRLRNYAVNLISFILYNYSLFYSSNINEPMNLHPKTSSFLFHHFLDHSRIMKSHPRKSRLPKKDQHILLNLSSLRKIATHEAERARASSRNKRGPTTGWLSRYRGRTKKKKKKKRGYINKQRVYRFVHAKGEGMTLKRIGESEMDDRRWPKEVWSERRGRTKRKQQTTMQRVVGFNEDESNFSGFLARAGRCTCSCAAIGWNSVGKVRGRVTADRIISICWNLWHGVPSEPSSDLSLWFHIVSRLKRRCDDLREELMGTCPFYPRGEMTSGWTRDLTSPWIGLNGKLESTMFCVEVCFLSIVILGKSESWFSDGNKFLFSK